MGNYCRSGIPHFVKVKMQLKWGWFMWETPNIVRLLDSSTVTFSCLNVLFLIYVSCTEYVYSAIKQFPTWFLLQVASHLLALRFVNSHFLESFKSWRFIIAYYVSLSCIINIYSFLLQIMKLINSRWLYMEVPENWKKTNYFFFSSHQCILSN